MEKRRKTFDVPSCWDVWKVENLLQSFPLSAGMREPGGLMPLYFYPVLLTSLNSSSPACSLDKQGFSLGQRKPEGGVTDACVGGGVVSVETGLVMPT